MTVKAGMFVTMTAQPPSDKEPDMPVAKDNKLKKFVIDDDTLKLETDDLIGVQCKFEFCLVGYIAGKFSGLKAIRALSQSWGHISAIRKILRALKNSLKAFNSLHYGHISVRAKEADLALQNAETHLESNPEDAAVWDSLGDLRKKATFLAKAERHFYYQKVKIHFLKQGDRNTKFFYDMVKSRGGHRVGYWKFG
ncbi:UNVERIFIED_CONTAM: hypothetical protein Scaly_2423100 [Sesamum calycinum]|uniref:Uncharacterized protein n=1 Tax=Sesamum calycinum TaxID=2727403 RepID=A0AAW2LZD8_9LAMI